jgi:DNA-binding LytR/AlgR family response regulator
MWKLFTKNTCKKDGTSAMAIQIAICDDEDIFLSNLKDLVVQKLQITGMDYELHIYDNGTNLLKISEKILFDIVFLDIEMPMLNGLEVAEKLREVNPFIHIIFVTNRDDLVFTSLRYRPFRFIRKQAIEEELPEAISHITQVIQEENQYYTFTINNSLKQIKIADIVYFESLKHDIYIHTLTEDIRMKSNLTKIEKEMFLHGFIRVHSGYLVNHRYIYSVNKFDVVLSNQASIPLSRHRAETVKQKLQLFARGTRR